MNNKYLFHYITSQVKVLWLKFSLLLIKITFYKQCHKHNLSKIINWDNREVGAQNGDGANPRQYNNNGANPANTIKSKSERIFWKNFF